ncbi:MAG TPA: SDR family oxidoreductase [Spirochaetota bacterium]|nr:SDR family oxidoreductase [Spirochaetota bacterium]
MKNVYFITGVTGFLGEEIMALLSQNRENRIYCMIRGNKSGSPDERLKKICAESGIKDTGAIMAVEGDLGSDNLGMDAETYDLLTNEVTHIIHSAADVRFNQAIEAIRKTNVGGTKNIVKFAKQCHVKNEDFSHLAYVGTCFVAGRRRGVAKETDLTDRYGFKNTYEQSKYEAEKFMRENMKDLPVIIYRPSIIVGLSESGRAKPRNVIYPILKLFLTWNIPAIPLNTRTRLDIVPVDFVAKAIVHLSGNENNIGKCFPLAAGPEGNVRLRSLLPLVTDEFGKKTKVIPASVWRVIISPVFRFMKPGLYKKVIKTFSAFEPYVWDMSPQYSTSATRLALEGSGISLPDTRRFISNCFRFAKETDFGEKNIPEAHAVDQENSGAMV